MSKNPKNSPLIPPLSLKEFKTNLLGAKKILLSTHQLPDGDGLGAEAALYHYLKSKKKECVIINPDPLPARYQFLDPKKEIFNSQRTDSEDWDLWIILDTNDPRRLGPLWKNLYGRTRKIIFLDHHTDLVQDTGISIPAHTQMISNPKLSSIGELLYEVFQAIGFDQPRPEVALGLYVSIMTDTNSFRSAQTTPAAHHIAGELLTLGIQPEEIYQTIYSSKESSHLKLLGRLLQNLEETPDQQIAWIKLERSLLNEYEAVADDTLSFLNLLLLIRKAEIICFFREEDHGKTRVSMKSKGRVRINALAMELGGGGHENAAGASLSCSLDEAIEQVIQKLQALLASSSKASPSTHER